MSINSLERRYLFWNDVVEFYEQHNLPIGAILDERKEKKKTRRIVNLLEETDDEKYTPCLFVGSTNNKYRDNHEVKKTLIHKDESIIPTSDVQ